MSPPCQPGPRSPTPNPSLARTLLPTPGRGCREARRTGQGRAVDVSAESEKSFESLVSPTVAGSGRVASVSEVYACWASPVRSIRNKYEKSCSRRALREMLETAGLDVVAETAIRCVPRSSRSGTVRRHGYLLATVV